MSPRPRRLILLSNRGAARAAATDLQAAVDELRALGHDAELRCVAGRALEAAAKAAAAQGPDVLLACGGDGTVNAVARAVAGSSVALGIVPLGTFNYVARRYAIPDDPTAATRLAASARPQPVGAADINGRLFLNNCSLGLHSDIIEARERHTALWGRARGVALASALLTTLRGRSRLRLQVRRDGGAPVFDGRLELLFVGLNPLPLREAGLDLADAVGDGRLGVVLLRPLGAARALRLLFSAAARRLETFEAIDAGVAETLRIDAPRSRLRVVVDGELLHLDTPLAIRHRPQALKICANAG